MTKKKETPKEEIIKKETPRKKRITIKDPNRKPNLPRIEKRSIQYLLDLLKKQNGEEFIKGVTKEKYPDLYNSLQMYRYNIQKFNPIKIKFLFNKMYIITGKKRIVFLDQLGYKNIDVLQLSYYMQNQGIKESNERVMAKQRRKYISKYERKDNNSKDSN